MNLTHAVHGTWVDLVMRHLEVSEKGFTPDPTWMRVDARLMLPTCVAVIAAARAYLVAFLPRVPELEPLYERMADLEDRLFTLNEAHERWMGENH